MRHGKSFNHLGRQKGHRRALLKNLSCALIEHKRINTTLAKAKALRKHIEPLITKSKVNTTHSRRVVFSYLQDKEAVKELFDGIATKVASRPGGYVRIIKTGFRKGDAAEMAMIELVDYNDVLLNTPKVASEKKGKTRRSRRGGGNAEAAAAGAATVAATDTVVEETEEVVEEVADTTNEVVEETTTETTTEKMTETTTEVVEEATETTTTDMVEETTKTVETTTSEVVEDIKETIKGSDPEMDKLNDAIDDITK